MRRFSNDRRGFTLVELMITIVIVGVLAAVAAIPLYQSNVTRAKTAERLMPPWVPFEPR